MAIILRYLTEVGILSGANYAIVAEGRPTLSATKNVSQKSGFRRYSHRLLKRVR